MLNNYYNGLEDDQLTREYDKTVSEIKLLKERIADCKLTNEDDMVQLFKEYKRKLKEKLKDMDEVKGEDKDLIKDNSYDIKDNPKYEEFFREQIEDQKSSLQ